MPILAIGIGFLLVALLVRFSPAVLLRPPQGALLALSVLAGLGAAASDAAPTGWVPLDLFLRAVLGATLVGAGSLCGRTPPLVSSLIVVAALVIAASPAALLGGLALGIALGGLLAPPRCALTGALTGGLLAQVVLRLDLPLVSGASLVVGLVVTLLMVLPALVRLPVRARRPLWSVAGAVTAVLLVGLVGGVVAALRVAGDVDHAVERAQQGLDLVGDDNRAAQEALEDAAGGFDEVRATLGAPWARPAWAVPLLAQQVRAVHAMARAGADLATVAAASIEEADVDRIRLVDGRVDLDAVRALQAPLRRADEALVRARSQLASVGSPWLVAPVAGRRVELLERLDTAAASAQLAAVAVEALPTMLGADRQRRYLLLIQQPAEARGSGGLPGNFAEITADDGVLDLVRVGRSDELIAGGIPPAERVVNMPEVFDVLYGYEDDLMGWKNLTFAPDFPTVAELARQLYPQSGGAEIDGVLSIDPTALAALLDLTGPVDLPGGRTLTSDNAEELLYFEQYLVLDDRGGNDERVELLGDATVLIWGRLTSGSLPGTRALADVLGPSVAAGHLRFVAFEPRPARLLDRLGMTGAMPQPRADGVGFALQNLSQNKIDWFSERAAEYEAAWDPGTGEITGTYRVTLHNAAPAGGLPDYIIGWGGSADAEEATAPGEQLSLLYLHTVGRPVAVRGGVALEQRGPTVRNGQWHVTPVRVRVPPGASTVVEVDVDGTIPRGSPWTMDVLRQPSIRGDELTVVLTLADGWAFDQVSGLDVRRGKAVAKPPLVVPVRLGASAQQVPPASGPP